MADSGVIVAGSGPNGLTAAVKHIEQSQYPHGGFRRAGGERGLMRVADED